MKKEKELQNQLKAVRTRRGMSQQDLATAAGVARQTIGGIEAKSYSLSMIVALRLAKALGCTVDELFWLEEDLPYVEATLIDFGPALNLGAETYVSLARVGERWIASPLAGDTAYRRELIPADGIALRDPKRNLVNVRLFDQLTALSQTVSVAGCAPAISLWAQSAERWHPGLRIQRVHANSMAALTRLAAREVHIAGVHLIDRTSGEGNASFVRAALNGVPAVLVNLGIWEEGMIVAQGNPKGITDAGDLTRADILLANREEGAGSRVLLDALLVENGSRGSEVRGYDSTFTGHPEVAEEICEGRADVAISTAAIARAYGLSFLAVQSVHYDLALRKESLDVPAVQQLLATLNHRWVRKQLAALGGYDTTFTGEISEIPL